MTTINTTYFNKTQWNAISKFTANKKDFRKIIQGIHFTNEYATATDTHRAVFIHGNFSDNSGLTLDKEYQEITFDHSYPSMQRFLDNNFNDTNNQFKAEVNELLQIHKDMLPEAKQKDKNTLKVCMDIIIDERVMFYVDRNSNTAYESETSGFRTWKHDDLTKGYNCKFMIEALSIFKAFKYKEVIIKYHEKMQPITLKSKDEKIKIMIMPIRTYSK